MNNGPKVTIKIWQVNRAKWQSLPAAWLVSSDVDCWRQQRGPVESHRRNSSELTELVPELILGLVLELAPVTLLSNWTDAIYVVR